jgi:transcriptional regulator with XRE-family HTH domain
MGTAPSAKPGSSRSRVEPFDRHLGARILERRIALGLTQQRFAKLIGVSDQQAHKYEKGISRISAGQLYRIARALNVDIGYLVEGIEPEPIRGENRMPQRKLLLGLARNFMGIPVREHQEAILTLARALAEHRARRRRVQARAD